MEARTKIKFYADIYRLGICYRGSSARFVSGYMWR